MAHPTTPRLLLPPAPAGRDRYAGSDPVGEGGVLVGAANVAVPAAISRPTLMTAEQVAAEWQVSVSLVYKLRREGKLPFVRIGTLYRFDPEAIRGYVRGEMTMARRVR